MKIALIILALLIILYIGFASQQKSFKCGYQKGAGQTASKDCK